MCVASSGCVGVQTGCLLSMHTRTQTRMCDSHTRTHDNSFGPSCRDHRNTPLSLTSRQRLGRETWINRVTVQIAFEWRWDFPIQQNKSVMIFFWGGQGCNSCRQIYNTDKLGKTSKQNTKLRAKVTKTIFSIRAGTVNAKQWMHKNLESTQKLEETSVKSRCKQAVL